MRNAADIGFSWVVLLATTLFTARVASGENPGEVEAVEATQTPPIAVAVIKATQNPLTLELGSIAFQNEFGFGLGPEDEFGYGLFIKPSVPIVLSERWSLINRMVLPVTDVPSLVRGGSRTFGLGDLQHTTLLSPTTTSRRMMWGLGPSVGFPTATDDLLGTGKWLLGPTAIFVFTPRRSVVGVVVKNLWSVGGESERRDVSSFVLQPLLNINLDQGWFITSKPIISANWKASSGERWLVPVGGGIGKVFRIGRFGLSLEAEAFGYPERPAGGPTWSVGLGVKVLFQRGQILERIRELGSETPSS
jgi:hypothetical protein